LTAQRRSRPSPDDRWEEYSVVVAAPKRATPEPAPADAQPSRVTAGEGDRSPPKTAQRDAEDERPSPEQPAAKAIAASVTNTADEAKAGPSAADSSNAHLVGRPDDDDNRQRALEPPAQSASEAPVMDRSAALLSLCICYVNLCVNVLLHITVVLKSSPMHDKSASVSFCCIHSVSSAV